MDALTEIGEFMSSPVLRIDFEASVQDAVIFMEANHIGSLIVEKYGDDVGLITERNIVRKIFSLKKNPEEIQVSDIMNSIPKMDRFLPIEEANQYMHDQKIRHLAITETDKIVGMLSVTDLVKYYSQDFRMQE